jgi:VWFA-related protein
MRGGFPGRTRARSPAGDRPVRVAAAVWAASALLLTLAQPSPRAQDPPPSAGAAPITREEVHVHLVRVPILALDKDDRPVTDLRADELTIRENGHDRTITAFEPQFAPPPVGPAPRARINFNAADGEPPSESPAGEPRWFVLFFDLVHGDLRSRITLHDAALTFARDRLRPEDRVSVVSYNGEILIERQFTSSRAETVAAIERAFTREALAVSWQARMQELLMLVKDCQAEMAPEKRFAPGRECVETQARNYIREYAGETRQFIDAIDTMSRLLSGIAGRKFMFLFSHGVPIDPTYEAVEAIRAIAGGNTQIAEIRFALQGEEDHGRPLADAIDRAIRGGVSIFTLDGTPQPAADFTAETRIGFRKGAMPYAAAFTEARDGLDDIASSTGGRFFGSSDFLHNMERALDATRGAYTLAFTTDPSSIRDTRDFIKISVRCARKGVRISTRSGYFYASPTPPVRHARLSLGDAVASGRDSIVPFTLTVDPATLTPRESPEDVLFNFTVHLRLRTTSGTAAADEFHFLSHVYPRAAWEKRTVVAPTFEGSLELAPGTWLFTAIVGDPSGDTLDEETETIEAREPPAAPASN